MITFFVNFIVCVAKLAAYLFICFMLCITSQASAGYVTMLIGVVLTIGAQMFFSLKFSRIIFWTHEEKVILVKGIIVHVLDFLAEHSFATLTQVAANIINREDMCAEMQEKLKKAKFDRQRSFENKNDESEDKTKVISNVNRKKVKKDKNSQKNTH